MSHKRSPSTCVEENNVQFLKVKDSKSGEERRLAYIKMSGTRAPGILYIPGLMGRMNTGKIAALHDFCKKHGFPYIRYDATALGKSEGPIELKDARFSHWLQDAEEVLLRLTEGPHLIVASSMGAWIASILAKKYPAKVNSLLLLAPSINFSNRSIQMIIMKAPASLIEKLERGESFEFEDSKHGNYPVSLPVFQEMIPYELPIEAGGYPVSCPIRIIHGTRDKYTPYEDSLKLFTGYESSDISVLYIKGSDHDLDDHKSLENIYDMIIKMTSSSTL